MGSILGGVGAGAIAAFTMALAWGPSPLRQAAGGLVFLGILRLGKGLLAGVDPQFSFPLFVAGALLPVVPTVYLLSRRGSSKKPAGR